MSSRLVWQSRQFFPRDAVESHGPGDQVERNSVGPEYFRQPPHPLAAQVVQLKQPVLGHRVAEAEPQIILPLGEDVRDAVAVAMDRDVSTHCRS